jgi:hypothetical protein
MTSEEFIQKILIFDDHETPRFVGPDKRIYYIATLSIDSWEVVITLYIENGEPLHATTANLIKILSCNMVRGKTIILRELNHTQWRLAL